MSWKPEFETVLQISEQELTLFVSRARDSVLREIISASRRRKGINRSGEFPVAVVRLFPLIEHHLKCGVRLAQSLRSLPRANVRPRRGIKIPVNTGLSFASILDDAVGSQGMVQNELIMTARSAIGRAPGFELGGCRFEPYRVGPLCNSGPCLRAFLSARFSPGWSRTADLPICVSVRAFLPDWSRRQTAWPTFYFPSCLRISSRS